MKKLICLILFSLVLCSEAVAQTLSITNNFSINNQWASFFPETYPAYIISLIPSLTEITVVSDLQASAHGKGCSDSVNAITIFAVGASPVNDVVTIDFKVSGGSIVKTDEKITLKLRRGIIGIGAKAVWDLSKVKPGIYTLTAVADEGCGCGKPMTKTVVVKGCSYDK